MREKLIRRIIELQRRVNRAIRERTLDSWVKLDLTIPQLKSLFYVSGHGKVNPSALAAGIHVTPANVTGIVDRLIEQGLLTRTGDADDRRISWLTVTDKGKTLINDLREGRAQEMRRILDKLTEEQLAMVAHGFELAATAAEAGEGKEPSKND
jgi:MarR family transcriptional regulator, organic hydroperoxide resistance regulator